MRENTAEAIALRDELLGEYLDLLAQKRPELVGILRQLDEHSVRTIDFRAVSYRPSQRLQ